MPLKIKLKRFTASSGDPSTSDLEVGEVGINPVQKKIFVNNSGTIVALGSADFSAVDQDIIPDGNGTRNLGSTTKRFKELFLLGQTIDLGGAIDSKLQTAIRNAIAGAAVNQLGGNVNAQNLVARTTGQVLNSNLELLFGGVNLRSFPFSITFTRRYEEEALEVKRIIRQFKMSMAAKAGKRFSGGSASGIFLSSPDVFSLR